MPSLVFLGGDLKMCQEENHKWEELYFYVKFQILEYEPRMNIPKHMVLKLKELRTGRIMANTNQLPVYEYSYEEILLTFKIKRADILYAIQNKEFKDENNKFNYIIAIIKSHINDVVDMIRRSKKQKEKIEQQDMNHYEHNGAEYKKKDKKISDKLKDLW